MNPAKQGMFTFEEREVFIKSYLKSGSEYESDVEITSFSDLLAVYCQRLAEDEVAKVSIVRGLRAVSDFEAEMGIANANQNISPSIPTVFIPTEAKHAFVSSSAAKELARFAETRRTLGTNYVHPHVAKALRQKFGHD